MLNIDNGIEFWNRIREFVSANFYTTQYISNITIKVGSKVCISVIDNEYESDDLFIPCDVFFSEYSAKQWIKEEQEKQNLKRKEEEEKRKNKERDDHIKMIVHSARLYQEWLDYKNNWEGSDTFEQYIKRKL